MKIMNDIEYSVYEELFYKNIYPTLTLGDLEKNQYPHSESYYDMIYGISKKSLLIKLPKDLQDIIKEYIDLNVYLETKTK